MTAPDRNCPPALLPLLLALSLMGVPQASGRAEQEVGSLRGRIVDADTGLPLPGVRVFAGGVEQLTDTQGQYRFSGLPPGPVSIRPEGGSYLDISLTAPLTVVVTGNSDLQVIDLPVRLEGRISGTVRSPGGEPVPEVEVLAILATYSVTGLSNEYANGALWYHRADSTTTDDQGRYVFERIHAGRAYRVVALPPSQSEPVSDAPATLDARRRALAPTWYPASDSPETALPITLNSLGDRGGVDIRMLDSPSYCAEAFLDGEPRPMVQGDLGLRERAVRFFVARDDVFGPLNLGRQAVNGDFPTDGQLRICGLTPGPYTLAAVGPQENLMPLSYGRTAFAIADEDVGGLEVNARPLLQVNGEIFWETPGAGVVADGIVVRLGRAIGTIWRGARTPVPGNFTLEVPYGLHSSLAIGGFEPPVYVRDITYGGPSILHGSFLPLSANDRLRITLADDGASLEVRTVDAEGQPAPHTSVLLFSASAQSGAEVATTLVAGRSDQRGLYTAEGLPPGRYQVFAAENHPPAVYSMPGWTSIRVEKSPEAMELLLRNRATSTLVELGAGGNQSVSVSREILR